MPTAAQPKKQRYYKALPGHKHVQIINMPDELIAACHAVAKARGQKFNEFYLRAFAAAVQPDLTPAAARLRVAERADAAARTDAGKVTP